MERQPGQADSVDEIAQLKGAELTGVLEAANEDRTVVIGGYEIDRERAMANWKRAQEIVRERLGDLVPVDFDDITFERLEGNVVGRTEGGKISIDPITLMHPATRLTLALTIMHEIFHDRGEVLSEDLVDAMVNNFIPDANVNTVYDGAKMEAFAEKCELKVAEIWEYYRKGEFREIYLACGNLEEFRAMFPELTFTEKPMEHQGQWSVKEPQVDEGAALVREVREKVARAA